MEEPKRYRLPLSGRITLKLPHSLWCWRFTNCKSEPFMSFWLNTVLLTQLKRLTIKHFWPWDAVSSRSTSITLDPMYVIKSKFFQIYYSCNKLWTHFMKVIFVQNFYLASSSSPPACNLFRLQIMAVRCIVKPVFPNVDVFRKYTVI